jgi:hypothetical protein
VEEGRVSSRRMSKSETSFDACEVWRMLIALASDSRAAEMRGMARVERVNGRAGGRRAVESWEKVEGGKERSR